LHARDLSRIVLFYSVTFWLGLGLVGGVGLLTAPPPGLLDIAPRTIVVIAGIAGIAITLAYLVFCAIRRAPIEVEPFTVPVPPFHMAVVQVAISTADWLLAAAVFYVLLPPPRPDFMMVGGAFVCAQILGLVSHVPGGLGVFEGLMVMLLGPVVPAATLLPVLVLYRIVYYLLPLAVALAILLGDEMIQRRGALTKWSQWCRTIAVWAAPRVLAFFAFASGVILLVSGVTPSDPGRLAWLARLMPLALIEVSHFAASLAGVLLLLLAQAIARRVDAAFYVTAGALAVGCVGSLLKGGDYEEATILALVLLALWAGRHHFTRRARLFEQPISAGWLAAVGSVVAASTWLGFFAYRQVAYSHALWWQFAFEADAPRFLRASVAVTMLVLVVGVRQLLRPTPVRPAESTDSMNDIDRVIALQPHTSPYLAYLGDKSFLWHESRGAFLMYSMHGRSCIALGDPVGSPSASRDLINRFLAMTAESGMTPVFYQATPERLSDYIEFGMSVTKIGEEARVRLDRFTLAGTRNKAFRASLNHVRKRGLTFRVVEPIDVPALLSELQDVSDEWLAMKGAAEKGFSLGFFDPDYLRHFPIAVLEFDGRVQAFTNLWCGPGRIEISPDLLRHRVDAPNGAMDALMVHVIQWAREQGYEWLNLGVAPLSGVQRSPTGHTWSHVARFVYGHGARFYNFQGLRAYKEKFDPEWTPRYVVHSGNLALPRVLADVTALIAGGYRRLFVAGRGGGQEVVRRGAA
jgi:phosphatidylglycerol lysyltransferase